MKLRNLVYAVGIFSLLQGCATPALDMTQLAVYPDNRIGYTLSRRGSSGLTRVWSSGETILALRFGNRLINAKDIESVVAQMTDRKNVPLHIAVRLKSGESLVADVADWGRSIYSDILVEWLACDRNRVCEYLERKQSIKGLVSFKDTPNFLISLNESSFESIARLGNIENYLSYKTDSAIPHSTGLYQLRFESVAKISNLRDGIEAERTKLEKFQKCMAEAVATEQRSRKLTEEEIIKTTPPGEVQKKLAMWRATLNTGFSQTMVLEMGCK